jgi:carbon-monoxide dehydrogenase medium subunit
MEERIGSDYSDANVGTAAEGLGATLDPPSDVHASADYRRQLAEVLAVRAVVAARERR